MVQFKTAWLGEMIASRHFLTTPSGAGMLLMDVIRMAAVAVIAVRVWQALETPCGSARQVDSEQLRQNPDGAIDPTVPMSRGKGEPGGDK